ncbi:NAD(P)-dependent alcohol dehydrogenase [Mycolicibacterium holsaticum]|uniref:NAD(P)-dependent alcohol dehydrogenase n=1 Tax=Mycolicibacterium holsaticum TaxID=152142 RepID=UPI001E2D8606|nr:NAD(P)-dependent alcohol dehydrogenase [Mycolicibacterium holsaticum]MDA4109909.1 alcohol dehydrogenase [Mycolicibacterium holsaticum DSM 44478 = JCM 12374]
MPTMRAARMYGYRQPLKLEEIPIPDIAPDQVLVKVGGAGMCRTDFQLIDGYFGTDMALPATPGHEIAGTIDRLGADVPAAEGLSEGDHVVVFGPQGDGSCRQCHRGNEHICNNGHWIGFGPHGGYQEYVPVAYQQLIKVSGQLSALSLAPLTDAGLTPYRGLKKLRAVGVLGPGTTLAVMGVGGLGAYAVQYAKLLGAGATVVALARNDEKLALATENGADHAINIGDKTDDEVRETLAQATGRPEFDAVIECAGAQNTIRLAFALLATEGAVATVGLVGNRVDMPLFPLVSREYTLFGSFWGNYNDLTEVIALAEAGKIKDSVTEVRFEDVNDHIEALGRGDFVGRAVIVYD